MIRPACCIAGCDRSEEVRAVLLDRHRKADDGSAVRQDGRRQHPGVIARTTLQDTVTVGVPVYRGERFLEEALSSIQRQTHADFQVIMSVDSPDPTCEAICARFLADPRFSMVVQAERLGWVGNLNWLLSQVSGEFWCYHQQDDLMDEQYLEKLIGHARTHPTAAIVYSDIIPIGRLGGGPFTAPSVLGASPYGRIMTMLQEHFPAFAFRGLTRAEALRQAGPVLENAVTNFGVDISWVTAIARYGELHRVPEPLYRKRYHDRNTNLNGGRSRRRNRSAVGRTGDDVLTTALPMFRLVPSNAAFSGLPPSPG